MIERQPNPEWAVLPRPGCVNVEFRLMLRKDDLAIAHLRFGENATIDQHSAPFDIDVLCTKGAGFVSINKQRFAISEGDTIRWPKGLDHCLWTMDETMETMMVERHISKSR